MNDELIADLWNVTSEHIAEKKKDDVASDFVNVLLDYGIKESSLKALKGIDAYLDNAIDYAIDDDGDDEDEE